MRTQLLKTPTRVVNFAQIMPLAERKPANISILVRPEQAAVVLARGPMARPVPLRNTRTRPRVNLTAVPVETYSVGKASGSISRAAGVADLETTGAMDLRLPIGMPRFVNVATLKKMLNAKASETLLRRDGERWSIAEDSLRVDLLDATVEFRLGTIQIFS